MRTLWDDEHEKRHISIVDKVVALTDSSNDNNYWKAFKNQLKKEGSNLFSDCYQLKLQSSDSN